MNQITLSPMQQAAVDQIAVWIKERSSPDFRLGGYAGSGKTSLVKHIIALLGSENVIVLAPTGKACSVLRRKGVTEARTIHNFLYKKASRPSCLPCEGAGKFGEQKCSACGGTGRSKQLWWEARESVDTAKLVIVDEASMVGAQEYHRLMDTGMPILWVGDPAQLEPVRDDPKIMHSPTVTLTEIHRTDRPTILDLSTSVRAGNVPSGPHVLALPIPDPVLLNADVIIAGTNRTRQRINTRMRALLGRTGLVCKGDKLICLRNNKKFSVVNGDIGIVLEHSEPYDSDGYGVVVLLTLAFDHMETIQCEAVVQAFGALKTPEFKGRLPDTITIWDYGYCLTAHKAQGSEWPKVAVIEECWKGIDAVRWRYTTITRASQKLGYYRSGGSR